LDEGVPPQGLVVAGGQESGNTVDLTGWKRKKKKIKPGKFGKSHGEGKITVGGRARK